MPKRTLTWNLYHGALPAGYTPAGQTPMQRLQYIANLCNANNIDIVCLQEVRQADLDNTVGFGVPGAASNVMGALGAVAGFLGAYTVLQAYDENNPTGAGATATSDGYLIMYRNATFPNPAGGQAWANFGYYNAAQFQNQYGVYLRSPVMVDLTDAGGTVVGAMTWHAQSDAPGAGWSLEILDGLLGNANTYNNPMVLAGDFNVRGNFASVFGGAQNFPNWDNIVATYPGPGGAGGPQISGLDHVLCSTNGNAIIANQLNFTSDAYHYPIAAQF
jgi:hypothetical protein